MIRLWPWNRLRRSADTAEGSDDDASKHDVADYRAVMTETEAGEVARDGAILQDDGPDGSEQEPFAEGHALVEATDSEQEIPWQMRDDLELDPPAIQDIGADTPKDGKDTLAVEAQDAPGIGDTPEEAAPAPHDDAAEEAAPAPLAAAAPRPAEAPAPRPVLTFAYIVEPPQYEFMACTLLASIRSQFGPEVQAIGYCPEHRMDELHPAVLKAHEIMGSEVRPMRTQGMWDEDYPHGNKIIAAMQPRDSEYSAFVDSDVMFLRPNTPDTLVKPGHVSASKAASMLWGEDEVWETIYGAFGMDVPEERIDLMRRGVNRVPYFSAGLVVFPENGENGRDRFPDVWYDTARTLDRIEEIPRRRPYLDQQSLPVAIRRAGLKWNEIPEDHHYILGGKLRGEALPDREIMTVHYRKFDILRELGLHKEGRRMLFRQTGQKYVRRLAETPDNENAGAE